jgi:hypothetical protein
VPGIPRLEEPYGGHPATVGRPVRCAQRQAAGLWSTSQTRGACRGAAAAGVVA